MKKVLLLCLVSALSGFAAEDCVSPVTSFNELGYGTLSGRIQSLTMYRDYSENGSERA